MRYFKLLIFFLVFRNIKFDGFKKSIRLSSFLSFGLISVLVYGLITVGLAYAAPLLGSSALTIALNLMGVAGAPMLSLFIMGVFMPCVNSLVRKNPYA